jgi:hypothetical protein
MVAGVGSLRSCILIIEADNIFDRLHVRVFEFTEVLVHEVVAFHLVDGELRHFFFPVLPVFRQQVKTRVGLGHYLPIPSAIRCDTLFSTWHLDRNYLCSSIFDQLQYFLSDLPLLLWD